MGLDILVWVKLSSNPEPFNGFEFRPVSGQDDQSYPQGATHECQHQLFGRWYHEQYPRGDWPTTSRLLLTLLGSQSVEAVWVDCDCSYPYDKTQQLTLERIHQLDRHWVGQ